MSKVTVRGIGGVFFKANDHEGMQAWYRDHLGVDVQAWGGTVFHWRQADDPDKKGSTTWSIFKNDTEYFGDKGAGWMINYRVDDLHAALAALKEAGVEVDEKVEESDYGKFGWCTDPEGNRIELWQPPDGM